MIYKGLAFFTGITILAAAIFGLIKRQSYTNIVQNNEDLDKLVVAEFPGKFAVEACGRMEDVLPDCPVVLRVTPTGGIEHLNSICRQKVSIQEIYQGEGLLVDQEIYLTSTHWSLIIDKDLQAIERGFVNILKTGQDYLVFIDNKVDTLDDPLPVYMLYWNTLIAPVFCYADIPNQILPTGGNTTYVPYQPLRENEFFAETEEAVAVWLELKSKLLAAYPKNEF